MRAGASSQGRQNPSSAAPRTTTAKTTPTPRPARRRGAGAASADPGIRRWIVGSGGGASLATDTSNKVGGAAMFFMGFTPMEVRSQSTLPRTCAATASVTRIPPVVAMGSVRAAMFTVSP